MLGMKSILLVEDDPNDVELIIAGLAAHNLANDIVVARDGEEAIDYMECKGKFAGRTCDNPAVVLLDLKLPKVGGLEVLKHIKNDPKFELVPVVILTSSREDRDVVEGYRLGTNGYVVKPLDFHEFVDAVKLTGAFWAVINEPPPGSVRKK
jgi:DNA-binding response OmpR family regulator